MPHPVAPAGRFRVIVAALLAAAGLALTGDAAAEPDLAPPWPQGSALAGREGVAVTFPSHSPFVLADVGKGPEADPFTEARATLFLPDGAGAGAPVPAAILLHGASGVLPERELTYARQLAAMGVAALVIDSFGPRRDMATGFMERLLEITETMILADAFAGLHYLDSRPEIDAGRVVLIGFSYGAMAATYAAYAQVSEVLAPQGRRFAGHVAFYGPCIADFDDSRATGAPLLMLYGGRDAIIDPQRCAATARALEAGGGEVEIIVYPEALHQWDGRFSLPRTIGRNLAGCRFEVSRSGTVSAAFWPLQMNGPLSRKLALGMCTSDEGYRIGRDDAVRARSNADLARFLERVLAPPA